MMPLPIYKLTSSTHEIDVPKMFNNLKEPDYNTIITFLRKYYEKHGYTCTDPEVNTVYTPTFVRTSKNGKEYFDVTINSKELNSYSNMRKILRYTAAGGEKVVLCNVDTLNGLITISKVVENNILDKRSTKFPAAKPPIVIKIPAEKPIDAEIVEAIPAIVNRGRSKRPKTKDRVLTIDLKSSSDE